MIVIIDYGLGNVASVLKACLLYRKDTIISRDAEVVLKAERVILPGVGAFGDGMKSLEELGLVVVLNQLANQGVPVLGICLGMQLLGLSSEESVGVKGLGLIDFSVKRISEKSGLKIPHVGWNNVEPTQQEHVLFADIPSSSDFYFVHSFHVSDDINPLNVMAYTDYGSDLVCAVNKGCICGVQFHPEKSQKPGLQLLQNFLTKHEVIAC